MKLPTLPFTVTDWSCVPRTEHAGETGVAYWRTFHMGELRVRLVEYSPGYRPTTGATAGMCCTSSRARS